MYTYLVMEGQENTSFLAEKYPDLAGSKPVERAVDKDRREGEKVPDKKEARVGSYLDRLERITEDERGFGLQKKYLRLKKSTQT